MKQARRTLLAVVVGIVVVGFMSGQATAAPLCFGHEATIVGSSGSDTIHGTPGPDVIVGRAGGDFIEGRRGDDVICGGTRA